MDSSQNGIEPGAIEVEAEPGSALVGEVVEPSKGSLAWLESLPTVEVMGRELPSVHRIPAGSTWRDDSERGTRCALVKPSGLACGAPATRRYGVCLIHCGGGADPAAMSPKGTAKLARLRVQRELLGVGPRGMANPRAVARVAAAERAADIAEALLAPLDARGLAPLDRQRAAAVILGETFPAASLSVEVELPRDEAEVSAMGWAELQALAASLL